MERENETGVHTDSPQAASREASGFISDGRLLPVGTRRQVFGLASNSLLGLFLLPKASRP